MPDYVRYAVYYVPPSGPFADFGASWLGWDVDKGAPCPHPNITDLDVAAITKGPRKYGFHATLKPPMRLAPTHGEVELQSAVADLADQLAPVTVDSLKPTRIGTFIALTPTGNQTALNALAASCVIELDAFRAAPTDDELARRRAAGLTQRQNDLLGKWGYPYVMEEFRFHMTLTGQLENETAGRAMEAVQDLATNRIPTPVVIDQIALVGERNDGRFETIHKYSLRNNSTPNPKAL